MARKETIKKLHDTLIMRRDALRKALTGDLSMLKEMKSDFAGDVVDAALDGAQNEISSKLAEVESRELASIDLALERMREGTFGVCIACEHKIPVARLNVLPYATNCIDCQRAAETGGSGPLSSDWSRVMDTDISIK